MYILYLKKNYVAVNLSQSKIHLLYYFNPNIVLKSSPSWMAFLLAYLDTTVTSMVDFVFFCPKKSGIDNTYQNWFNLPWF